MGYSGGRHVRRVLLLEEEHDAWSGLPMWTHEDGEHFLRYSDCDDDDSYIWHLSTNNEREYYEAVWEGDGWQIQSASGKMPWEVPIWKNAWERVGSLTVQAA